MPTEVFEDSLDLKIGLIEATMPEWQAKGTQSPSYPLPLLTPIPSVEIRRFRTFLLENALIRVTVVPALGGRILSLFDKRTQSDILPRGGSLQPVAGGSRGAVLHEGAQVQYLSGEDRLNALGPVDVAAEEGEEPGIWIAESAGGGPLSFHQYLSVPPNRAELAIEARIFNRSLHPQSYNGGVSFHLPNAEVFRIEDGVAIYDSKTDSGLAVVWESPMAFSFGDGSLRISRFEAPGSLAPRQLDTFRLRVVPLSTLGGLSGAGTEGGVFFGKGVVRVQTAERRTEHKLLLVTGDGQTLEAPADLHPEHVVEIPIGETKPKTLVVRDPAKSDVLRADVEPLPVPKAIPAVQNREPSITLESPNEEVLAATMDVGQRSLAHTVLGMRALGRRDFRAASEQFERALLFNAEDHLTWWLKSLADRNLGEEGERAELLNAHYLAPLEPALRAEAFLSQGPNQGKEANPLVAPLSEVPENLVEVACLLLEAGLLPEATQWIDEALRHRDLQILHVLQAYALSHTRMDVEAARHVALAQGLVEPPFPHREIEWKAVQTVAIPTPRPAGGEGQG